MTGTILIRNRLVFTAALKDELPLDFIKACKWPVVTVQGLKSGVLASICRDFKNDSVIFVITGVGKKKSMDAAHLIAKTLKPLAVVNIGSCGINAPKFPFAGKKPLILASHTKTGSTLRRCLKELPFPVPSGIPIETGAVQSLKRPLLAFDPALLPAVDMEAGYQHAVFDQYEIPFSCVKVPTDVCSGSTRRQFEASLPGVRQGLKRLLSFLDPAFLPRDVSVIIPVHNRPAFVERAINSVLSQSQPPRETIVVDDGSSPPVEKGLSKKLLNRVSIIRLPVNRGVSAARNAGIRQASGAWIALMDSDDEWKRDKLRNQLSFLEQNPFFEIIQCNEIWIRRGRRVNMCKHHIKEGGWIWQKCVKMCAISPSGVLMRKELFQRFGYFQEDFPACEDYEMWLRIARWKPVGLNPEADLIKYGGHPDQLSSRFQAMDRYRVAALLKALENEENKKYREIIIKSIKKRLEILYNGAVKREKIEHAKVYEELLSNLERFGSVSWKDHPLLLAKYL